MCSVGSEKRAPTFCRRIARPYDFLQWEHFGLDLRIYLAPLTLLPSARLGFRKPRKGEVSVICHNPSMPTRSSKDHDFTTVAKQVVEQAIGEQWDGSPLPDKDAGKNPAAVALGKLGGAKGGAARAAALSPRKRSAIAKKAAEARWGKRA